MILPEIDQQLTTLNQLQIDHWYSDKSYVVFIKVIDRYENPINSGEIRVTIKYVTGSIINTDEGRYFTYIKSEDIIMQQSVDIIYSEFILKPSEFLYQGTDKYVQKNKRS